MISPTNEVAHDSAELQCRIVHNSPSFWDATSGGPHDVAVGLKGGEATKLVQCMQPQLDIGVERMGARLQRSWNGCERVGRMAAEKGVDRVFRDE
jgi:hypothetical protein